MADMTPARPGQNNGNAADNTALFLKVFAGEVLSAFDEANIMQPRTIVRTIPNGKSAQFPATWKATAAYHTPGQQILGGSILSSERVITIDDLLVSSVSIASIDEAMSHYDFRSEYTRQLGLALARTFDKNLLQVAILAARASATLTGGDGGTQITNATAKTDADSFVASLSDAAQALDEKNVPEGDRFVAVPPSIYHMLVNSSSKLLNRDYNPTAANGNVADGKVLSAHGIQIVKTNHLPTTNITTGPTAYQGDFTNTAAVVWHRAAVGTVKLIDLAVETQYLIEYQTTLAVAKYAVGHGLLRPECAVEIKIA